ncbi:MAG: hypothetical protein JSS27_21280 [Planctomycetes bacterium]|nr:hypothetical protein [Planctomycetota bacterium]
MIEPPTPQAFAGSTRYNAAMAPIKKKCELCDQPAVKDERYCKEHRKQCLGVLRESDYLTARPSNLRKFRDADSQENVRETKFGPDR